VRIVEFVYDVEPFDLERTNEWDSSTTVLIGSGTWQGGAINGTATAVIYIDDGSRHSAEAHLTQDELRVVVGQLNELLEAMEES
jgi:hypothetical protein